MEDIGSRGVERYVSLKITETIKSTSKRKTHMVHDERSSNQ